MKAAHKQHTFNTTNRHLDNLSNFPNPKFDLSIPEHPSYHGRTWHGGIVLQRPQG